jgi:hypothetical protein
LEASILEDFLQIHDGQTDEMAAFIRRHGLFAEEDLRLRARAAKEVQTRWKHIKAIGVIPFAIPLHEFWGTRRTIEALSDLMDALQRGEEERMLALSLELGSGFIKGYEDHRISDAYADARFLLAAVTGRWLATARVAPVEEKGKFITSIVTAFSRDAVYAQLMAHITAGNPLRRCKRLKCEVIFVPSRPDKQFCSLKCQNLAKSYRQKGIPNVERASTSLR